MDDPMPFSHGDEDDEYDEPDDLFDMPFEDVSSHVVEMDEDGHGFSISVGMDSPDGREIALHYHVRYPEDGIMDTEACTAVAMGALFEMGFTVWPDMREAFLEDNPQYRPVLDDKEIEEE